MYLIVVNFEGSLLRVLVGVLVGLSLIKYVKSFFGRILGSGKVSTEGKIFGLLLGDLNGASLGIYLG